MPHDAPGPLSSTSRSGSSSGVERKLPKLDVAGSIPVSRSILSTYTCASRDLIMVPRCQVFLLSCVLTAGCGPAPQPSHSPLDSPEHHYNSGLVSVEAGRLMEAQESFERAAALDDDFAGAYVGYALVAITQGEFFTARQQIEKALHKDNDYADAFLSHGGNDGATVAAAGSEEELEARLRSVFSMRIPVRAVEVGTLPVSEVKAQRWKVVHE